MDRGSDTLLSEQYEIAGGRHTAPIERIAIRAPISGRSVAFLSAAFAAALTVGAAFIPVSESRTVTGAFITASPTLQVVAEKPGIIEKLYVTEGTNVKVGDRLFDLNLGRTRDDALYPSSDVEKDYAEETVFRQTRIRTEAQRLQIAADRQRAAVASLREQKAQLRTRIQAQVGLVDSANARTRLMEPYLERGFVSRNEHERLKQEAVARTQELMGMRAQLAALEGDTSDAEAQAREATAQAQLGITEAQASLRTLREEHRKNTTSQYATMRAPAAGVVTALQFAAGQYADGRHPILYIVPAEQGLEVELLVPNEDAGALKVGQSLRLEALAYPAPTYGYFEGKVRWISRAAIPADQVTTTNEAKTPVFIVRLDLDSNSLPKGTQLRSGMKISARIVIRRSSLVRFILPGIKD